MATVTHHDSAAIDSHAPSSPTPSHAGLRVLARLPDVSAPSHAGWKKVAGRWLQVLPDRRGIVIGVSAGLALAALLSVREHRRRTAPAAAPPAAVTAAPVETTLPPLPTAHPALDSSARLEGTVEMPHTASHSNAASESSVR